MTAANDARATSRRRGILAVVGLGIGTGIVVMAMMIPPGSPDGPSMDEQPPTRTDSPAARSPGESDPTDATDDGTRYVAQDGNDGHGGTSGAPWRTLQWAVDHALDDIVLLEGTYDGAEVTRSGITVAGAPGEEAVISGQLGLAGVRDVVIRDITVQEALDPYQAGILVTDSSRIRISNVTVVSNSFGIHLKDSTDVLVEESEITRNGSGVEVHGNASGLLVRENRIHHNDRAVDASRGANGINFFRSTGPAVVTNNELWANFNPAPAPGTDIGGGAFEIYASSDITMTRNTMWDNGVLETGTEAGIECDNLTFTHNVAWRGSANTLQDGLVLRCFSNSLVAHNTFDGLDNFAVDVIHQQGAFAGSIEGLRIVNNVFVNGRVYSIDNQMPRSVEIDHNLVHNAGSDADFGQFLAYAWDQGNTSSFSSLQSWGYEVNGISQDPLFVNREGRDYRLQADSPARAAGTLLPGINDSFAGPPDLGRLSEQDTGT